MAWGALREALVGVPAPVSLGAGGGSVVAAAAPTLAWHRALRLGLTVTVVNPATITSWLTVGGSFISQNLVGRGTAESLLLMSGIWVGTAAWFTVLAGIVGVARAAVGRIPWLFRAVGGLSGLVLGAFAVRFAWQLAQGLLALSKG